jgi:hypothetical protein
MSVSRQVVNDFNSYPDIVGKVGELLAKGDSDICVILGDRQAVATSWDGDIRAEAMKVGLDPKYENGIPCLGYLGWTAGSPVHKPVVAGTLTVTARDSSLR